MISSLTWIPKGAPRRIPLNVEQVLSEEEFQKISLEIGAEIQDLKLATPAQLDDGVGSDIDMETEQTHTGEDADLARYNLDTYDDEPSQGGLSGIPVFGNTPGLTYYEQSDEKDPYVVLDDDHDKQEELKEMEILPTDSMILACKTEDDLSHLEVYLYEQEEDNLYIHHDIMLPSFPLCSEWLDYRMKERPDAPLGSTGNYVAIGTFEPEIEIWDLDVIDAVYPEIILGASVEPSVTAPVAQKKKKKSKRDTKVNQERHISAVTSLSWNKSHRNLILSASADTTVKLWDLSDGRRAVKSYHHHSDKVTAVSWNQQEPTVFLTGGYDQGGRVCALDSRMPEKVASWVVSSDVECIQWDPFHAERFIVSTEDGLVRCFDARNTDSNKPLYTLHAHDAAVSALSLSPHSEGLLVTGGADKTVKVWDIRTESKKCIASRDIGVGKVFTASFCMDSPFVVAASGSKGKVVIWNLENNASVRKLFNQSKTVQGGQEVVEIESQEEESDEEEALNEDKSDSEDEDMER